MLVIVMWVTDDTEKLMLKIFIIYLLYISIIVVLKRLTIFMSEEDCQIQRWNAPILWCLVVQVSVRTAKCTVNASLCLSRCSSLSWVHPHVRIWWHIPVWPLVWSTRFKLSPWGIRTTTSSSKGCSFGAINIMTHKLLADKIILCLSISYVIEHTWVKYDEIE